MSGDDQHPTNAPDGWQFKSEDTDATSTESQTQTYDQGLPAAEPPGVEEIIAQRAGIGEESVTWKAPEFIAHDKGVNWYLALTLITIAAVLLVYLLTRDKISSGVVVVAAIVFGVYAARKPRTLEYRLGGSGLSAGDKLYDYGQFRSFSVMEEGSFSSVTFMPLKRLMPTLTVYYAHKDEQKIVQVLADRLPMEKRDRDPLDRFLHHIRF